MKGQTPEASQPLTANQAHSGHPQSAQAQSAKPWYKEPLMWLVLGLPAAVVVAGVSTVIIASSNPETLVSAPHTKVGLTVQRIEGDARQ